MGRRVSPRLRRSHRENQKTTKREWTFDGATATTTTTTTMDNASRFCASRAGASSGGYTTRSPGRSARLFVSACVSNVRVFLLRLLCRVFCSFYPKDKKRERKEKNGERFRFYIHPFAARRLRSIVTSRLQKRMLVCVYVYVLEVVFIPFGAAVLYRVLPLFCPTRVSTPSRRLSPTPRRRSRFQYPLRLLERVYPREITRRRFVRW